MDEYLSSKSNEKIKTVRKLTEKKHRTDFGGFVIEGHKLVSEYVEKRGAPLWIFVTEEASQKYRDLLLRSGCHSVFTVTDDLYGYISGEKAPQGIMAVCPIPPFAGKVKSGNVIILESLRDAGNLGTVIRTAAAFGIPNVLMSDDCADLYNPKTLRGAMGAAFGANIAVSHDLADSIRQLKAEGRAVYAAMPSGEAYDVRELCFGSDDCIVVGNEGNGITPRIAAECSGLVTIPMSAGTESLNASVAASILMWELVRNRKV